MTRKETKAIQRALATVKPYRENDNSQASLNWRSIVHQIAIELWQVSVRTSPNKPSFDRERFVNETDNFQL